MYIEKLPVPPGIALCWGVWSTRPCRDLVATYRCSLTCLLNYCSAGPWFGTAVSTLLPPIPCSFVSGVSFPGFRAVRSFLCVLVRACRLLRLPLARHGPKLHHVRRVGLRLPCHVARVGRIERKRGTLCPGVITRWAISSVGRAPPLQGVEGAVQRGVRATGKPR